MITRFSFRLNFCLLTFALLTVLLAAGCRDDDDVTVIDFDPNDPVIFEGTYSVAGRVLLDIGGPVPDVTVESLGHGVAVVTDSDGYYKFENIPLPTTGAVLTFTHEFLFPEYRHVVTEQGGNQLLDVELKRVPVAGEVLASEGGTISTTEGNVWLTIPANAALLGGQPYTGRVSAKIYYEDPNDHQEMLQSAGNFPGLHPSRGRVSLGSYGMVHIQLTDGGNNAVTFPEDNPAQLNTVLFGQFETAPRDSILFWTFTPGGWVFNPGELPQDRELFSVDVFGGGYFNWDVPFRKMEIRGRIVDDNGQPQPGVIYSLALPGGPPVYVLRTDQDGRFHAPGPAGLPFELIIYDPCDDQPLTTSQLGPFDVDTDLGDLAFDINLVARSALTLQCATNLTTDVDVYVDGNLQPNGLVRDAAGTLFLLASDCDDDGRHYIQILDEGNGTSVSTSTLRILDATNPEGLILEACSQLEAEEVVAVNFQEGTVQANGASFLLVGDPNGFRQRVYGSRFDGSDEVLNLTVEFPLNGTGPFGSNEASVELTAEDDLGRLITYRCAGDCSSLSVAQVSSGLGAEHVEGIFNFTAERVLPNDDILPGEVTVSGTFKVIR